LCVSLGIGIIRKSVPVVDIAACEPIRIKWWYGWGIHLTPHGWLYNVSGFDAVAISLRDGRKFALGTDDPDELVDAIGRYSSAYRWGAVELVRASMPAPSAEGQSSAGAAALQRFWMFTNLSI
jgi:hypothetical protein